VVNVALHAANSLLLFVVLRRMTGSRWRSAAVAALFAVHPLHVESVAWIAERKDVLSTLFFLLTLWAYHHYAASPRFNRWLLVFLVMALGLMAKSMLVTLPAVLLLLDFWPLRRFRGWSAARLLLEKLPLLALSLATAAVTVAAQASKGATAMLHDPQAGTPADLPVRLANAAITAVKYLTMTAWPADLAVYYPYDFHPPTWQAAGAWLLLLAATGGTIWCFRQCIRHTECAVRPPVPTGSLVQRPKALGGRHTECAAYGVGWFWYLGTLVPVIGLVQVGSQAMADRYSYIPSIGIFLAFVWFVADLARRLPWPEPKRSIVLAGAASAVLTAYLAVAHHQASCWINSERLFRHALAITGENPVACENLGDSLLHQERFAEAEVQFRKVLAMDAEHYRQTPAELAQASAGQGRVGEAIALVHAIPENYEKAKGMNNLAMFLAPRGHVTEAIELLQEAIKLVPEQPLVRENLARIKATGGNPKSEIRNPK
jgi:tetratricopeptide (TPR) repeat protein